MHRTGTDVAGGSRGSERPPTIVFVGKTQRASITDVSVRAWLDIEQRHVRNVWVIQGPGASERSSSMRVSRLPAWLGPAFYLVAPVLAVLLAVGRNRTAVVCKSPFEAFGVLVLTRMVPKRWRPPVQVELHGDWRTASRLYGSPKRAVVAPLADRVATWSLRHADRVRAVSELLVELARKAGCACPTDIFVTYSDYDAVMHTEPVACPEAPQVLFAGMLEPYKGTDVLLEAWPTVVAAVPDATLVVAGTGRQAAEIARRVETDGLAASIKLLGHVSRERVAQLLDESRCLVLPSRSEGQARIAIEAMARARCVVGTAVGGIHELVDDGYNGMLVESEDSAGLAAALVAVLSDQPRAAKMGLLARETVLTRDPATEYEAGMARLADWVSAA